MVVLSGFFFKCLVRCEWFWGVSKVASASQVII